MLRALILKSFLILNLAVASALAQQDAGNIRLPIGLALMDQEALLFSFARCLRRSKML